MVAVFWNLPSAPVQKSPHTPWAMFCCPVCASLWRDLASLTKGPPTFPSGPAHHGYVAPGRLPWKGCGPKFSQPTNILSGFLLSLSALELSIGLPEILAFYLLLRVSSQYPSRALCIYGPCTSRSSSPAQVSQPWLLARSSRTTWSISFSLLQRRLKQRTNHILKRQRAKAAALSAFTRE